MDKDTLTFLEKEKKKEYMFFNVRSKVTGCDEIAVVQLPSHVQLSVTLWTAECQASLSLLEFAQVHVH